jgi:probable phosphoglycerate mutase
MTYLWLVRHGQTDWNVQGRWQGQTPDAPPLNATGLAQAEAVAEQLAAQASQDGLAFAAIYSSDLLRARQTAEVIARRLGLPVQLDARLREVHLGVWEGMLGDEVALRYVAELDERRRDPVHSRPPQGESVYEVAARVGQAFDAIARAHPDQHVIVISHGLALAAGLCLAEGRPLAEVFTRIPDHAVAQVVRWWGRREQSSCY